MTEKPLDRKEEMQKDKPAILGGLDKKSMDNEAAATKKRYVEKRLPRTSELKEFERHKKKEGIQIDGSRL